MPKVSRNNFRRKPRGEGSPAKRAFVRPRCLFKVDCSAIVRTVPHPPEGNHPQRSQESKRVPARRRKPDNRGFWSLKERPSGRDLRGDALLPASRDPARHHLYQEGRYLVTRSPFLRDSIFEVSFYCRLAVLACINL